MSESEARDRVIAAARRVCDPEVNDIEFELRSLALAVNALYEAELERAAESDPFARGYLRALAGTRKELDSAARNWTRQPASEDGEEQDVPYERWSGQKMALHGLRLDGQQVRIDVHQRRLDDLDERVQALEGKDE